MSSPKDFQDMWPTTHWSQIGKAGSAGELERRQAISNLITDYLPALKWHLMRRGRVPKSDIDDVVQEFLISKILQAGIVEMARQYRGRFRDFLATSMDRFALNHFQAQSAQKRKIYRGEELDIEAPLPLYRRKHPDTFDKSWADQVLGQSLRKMRADCMRAHRGDIWAVFRGRVLLPYMRNVEPTSYAELVAQFSFQSASRASNILITANRMFARSFRSVIGRYELTETEIDKEISEIWQIFSRHRAG